MGYFIDRKFNKPEVLAELEKYGFAGRNYTKVIVTWAGAMKRSSAPM
jgi:hypothetical protein